MNMLLSFIWNEKGNATTTGHSISTLIFIALDFGAPFIGKADSMHFVKFSLTLENKHFSLNLYNESWSLTNFGARRNIIINMSPNKKYEQKESWTENILNFFFWTCTLVLLENAQWFFRIFLRRLKLLFVESTKSILAKSTWNQPHYFHISVNSIHQINRLAVSLILSDFVRILLPRSA